MHTIKYNLLHEKQKQCVRRQLTTMIKHVMSISSF